MGGCALAIAAMPAWAEAGPTDVQDVSRLSLEQLAMVQVTSVSKRAEVLAEAPASIFVITADDIRRSGAASLPEVLRLAPNINVQRVNALDYAVSARGFNGFETSNKLLVLVDGRSIYSTLSSGVFWDAHQMMLEDVERIEVVSGPGGALYGSNAMNGVINIITRSAEDTSGGLLSASAGTEEAILSARYGGRLGEGGAWRAYVTGFKVENSQRLEGGEATDAAEGVRAGFRLDGTVRGSALTLQGDAFDNAVGLNEDYSDEKASVRGRNLLGRLTRPILGGELQAQAYYDLYTRDESGGMEEAQTLDVNIQHASSWGAHDLVLGVGRRTVKSLFKAPPGAAFLDPAKRRLTLDNFYLQDQIALTPSLRLTLGVKYEANSFSGDELLPNLRLAWAPGEGALAWAAVSRASRTPNRIERDLTLPGFLVGSDFQSETATAYEAGYRGRRGDSLTWSASAFYTVYDDLRTVSVDPATILPLRLTNYGKGVTYGLEAWAGYDVSPDWRLSLGLQTLTKDFESPPPLQDISALASTGDDPQYEVSFTSQWTLGPDVDFDVQLRRVGALAQVDPFLDADARLAWRMRDGLELSLTGRNLFDEKRVETGDPVRARAFGRSVAAVVRVDF